MNPNEPNPKNAKHLPTELKQFEAQLKLLAPRPGRLDHDRLIFLAGQASVQRSSTWAWPTAFAVSTAVAASLLFLLVTQPQNDLSSEEFVSSRSISEPTRQTLPIVHPAPSRPSPILSSSPKLLQQIEKFLATGYREASGNSSPAVDWGDGHRLTPTSINFLMNESAKLKPINNENTQFHTAKNGAHA